MTPGDVNDDVTIVPLLIVSVDMTERRGIDRAGQETPMTYLAAESTTKVRLIGRRIPYHEFDFWEMQAIAKGDGT